MKQGIHPTLNKIVAKCSCGAEFETLSTNKELNIHICSSCHPFYTGKQRIVDTAGRVERFKQRYAKKAEEAKNSKKCPRTVTVKD